MLQGNFFQYFESSTKRKNLKGSLDMKDLTSIELVDDKSTGQKLLIRLVVDDAQLLLRAGTEGGALKWEMHLSAFLPTTNKDSQEDGAKLIQDLWKKRKSDSPKKGGDEDEDGHQSLLPQSDSD